jgi:hypothetical protein
MFASTKYFLPRIPRATPGRLGQRPYMAVSLTIFAILAAVLCGLTYPILGMIVPAAVGALMLSIVVLALSPPAIIWLMLVLVLLVVGQFTYFLGIQQAAWIPYLLLMLIAIKYLMEKVRITTRNKTLLGLGPSIVSVLIVLFCLLFCLSALANSTDFASVGVAAKNYIFPWFLTLLVVSAVKRTDDLGGIWKFMLWVVVVQVPFAISQHFYFAKLRGGENGLDAVVGSFGGSIYSGGASGAMAVFLVFGIVLAASLFQNRQIGRKMLAGVVIAAGVTVGLAEVKIFFIILPLGLILLFRSNLLSKPAKTFGYGIVGAAFLVLLMFVYQQTTSSRLSKANSMEGYIDHVLSGESDAYLFNPITRELSRAGAVLMWLRYNSLSDPSFYLGHGPAASRKSQTLGSGVAARKYPFTLTTSTASTLLWDVGLSGYALFTVLLLAAGLSALRLANSAPLVEKAALESIGVMLLLGLPLSFYNRDLIDSAVMQTLVAFWIGYVLLCRRKKSSDGWSLPSMKRTLPTEAK